MKHTLLLLLITTTAFAQFPALSSRGSLTQHVGSTTITVDYERPAARGRQVFGKLVPFDKLWRAGAGPSTKIGFSNAVTINKTIVPAGVYSLFAIPGKSNWTIILNKDTSLYGEDKYSQANDIVRITLPAKTSARFYESFSIDVDVVPYNADIYLSWANTQVSFTVDTGVEQKTEEFIKSMLLTKKSVKADDYATAAEYFYYLNTHADWAMTLIDHAITLDGKQRWYHRLKGDLEKGTVATTTK